MNVSFNFFVCRWRLGESQTLAICCVLACASLSLGMSAPKSQYTVAQPVFMHFFNLHQGDICSFSNGLIVSFPGYPLQGGSLTLTTLQRGEPGNANLQSWKTGGVRIAYCEQSEREVGKNGVYALTALTHCLTSTSSSQNLGHPPVSKLRCHSL